VIPVPFSKPVLEQRGCSTERECEYKRVHVCPPGPELRSDSCFNIGVSMGGPRVSEWMKYVWGHLAYSRDKVFQINLSRDAHFSRALCPRILCAGVNPFDRAFIKTRRETDATITCFPCVIESRLRFRENGGEWNLLCDYELRYASGSNPQSSV